MKYLFLILFCVLAFGCAQTESNNIKPNASNTSLSTAKPTQTSKEERLLKLVDGKILDTTIGENENPEDLIEIENLIKSGVDVNTRDKTTFKTPVMIAVQTNRITSLRLLLKASANPNLQDNEGRTALMTAASYNDVTMVKMLLEHGADAKIEDNGGYTALTGAQYIDGGEKYLETKDKYAYSEIRRLLRSGKNPLTNK